MAQAQGQTPKKGWTGFAIVLAFHALLIYGLANGLAQSVIDVIKGPIEAEIITEPPPPPEDVPPPPPPEIIEAPPFVPPPELNITTETPPETAITQVQSEIVPSGPTIGVRQDPKHPVPRPTYPASSKRLGQEGTVVLLLWVLEDGRVGDARIDRTSGFPQLDAAALRESRRWRFLPAQTEGKPLAAWYRIAVTFSLLDE